MMKAVTISLSSVDIIKSFCSVVSKVDYDVDLIRGRYIIDAKSIMGIYSLDLSKPVSVNLHCQTNEEYLKFLQDLKAKGIDYKEA